MMTMSCRKNIGTRSVGDFHPVKGGVFKKLEFQWRRLGRKRLWLPPLVGLVFLSSYQVLVLVMDSAGHVATNTATAEVSSGTQGAGNLVDFSSIQLLLVGVVVAAVGIVVSLFVYGFVLRRSRQQKPSSAQDEPDHWTHWVFRHAGEFPAARSFLIGMLGMYQKVRRRNYQ